MFGTIGLISTLLLGSPVEIGVEQPKTAADELVRDGARLGKAGDYEQAVDRFKRAEAMFSRAIHDCNIGLAYARWNKLGRAHAFLDRCRSRAVEALPAWVDKRARAVMEELRNGSYAPVEILADHVGATIQVSTFAADEVFGAPRVVWLPFGEHVIVVSLSGYQPQRRTLTIDSNHGVRVSIEFGPEAIGAVSEAEPIVPSAPDEQPSNQEPISDETSAEGVHVTEPPPSKLVNVSISSQQWKIIWS